MKKKRLALIVALAVSLVAGVVSLAACGGNDGDEAFSAPKNAKVSGTLFTWDAVEKADNGYTVKINSGEVQVTVTELDLTSNAATAYIKEGANSLSVKVNTTDALKESTYSTAVTYTYTISEDTLSEAAKAFKTAVEAIATLDASSDKAAIDGADAAITNALATYENLSGSDKTDVIAVKNSLDGKKEALNTAIAAQISAYKTAVEAAEEAANASVEELEAAIAAANAKKDALAEATKTAKAEEYAAYNTRLETVTAALDTMKGPAAAVKALKDEVDALSNETSVSVEYYNQLTALKEKIEALSDEAKALWDEADTAKVEAEITRVLKVAVDIKDADEAFGWGGNGELYIIREYYNVKGEIIDYGEQLTVTYTLTVDDVAGEEQTTTLTSENGVYVGKIHFNATQENTFAYTIKTASGDKVEDNSLSYAAFKANIWWATIPAGEERAPVFNNNDKLYLANTYGDHTYAYIYSPDVIVADTYKDADVEISGVALAKVEVTSNMSREALYRTIAREHGDVFIGNNIDVRFLFVSETVEDGKTVRTCVNSGCVSEVITLSLTSQDAKYRIENQFGNDDIYDIGVWGGDPGVFSLIKDDGEAYKPIYEKFISQFEELYPNLITKETLKDYFQILISAYDDTTDELLFSKAVPFKNQAYDYVSFMRDWTVHHFVNKGEDNETVTFYLTLTIQLKDKVNGEDNPLAKDYKDSASANVMVQSLYTGSYTFQASDVTLSTDIQIERTNEVIFMSANSESAAKDMINGSISCIEIRFTKDADKATYYTVYILYHADTQKFVIHKNADGSDAGVEIQRGADYWKPTNDINNLVKEFDSTIGSIDDEGLFFQTKLIDNAEDDTYLFGEGESEWVTFYKAPAPDTGDGE
ncbi:MAG: hypothetical protein K2K12_06020 [Clostridia bacterium]|nr:hypothetical protein [Clostridia bacterium]